MTRKRQNVHDLRALKGQKQLTMLRIFTLDKAAAVEDAGIDIVSAPPEGYLRFCGEMLEQDVDALYCSGSFETVAYWASEYIPAVRGGQTWDEADAADAVVIASDRVQSRFDDDCGIDCVVTFDPKQHFHQPGRTTP